ncbi:NitT/TauT family transport system permease protein [Microvirga guangxiensis]|uniref:NitT/TauT family transport system permease protein n=2 Tax=Microvirga guangxiensis TaxID=549386 RepID=A0A1G5KMZ9_9HYPH|nr:NitT/TauT family transport system permease protein [Microvirga guangxiensis]
MFALVSGFLFGCFGGVAVWAWRVLVSVALLELASSFFGGSPVGFVVCVSGWSVSGLGLWSSSCLAAVVGRFLVSLRIVVSLVLGLVVIVWFGTGVPSAFVLWVSLLAIVGLLASFRSWWVWCLWFALVVASLGWSARGVFRRVIIVLWLVRIVVRFCLSVWFGLVGAVVGALMSSRSCIGPVFLSVWWLCSLNAVLVGFVLLVLMGFFLWVVTLWVASGLLFWRSRGLAVCFGAWSRSAGLRRRPVGVVVASSVSVGVVVRLLFLASLAFAAGVFSAAFAWLLSFPVSFAGAGGFFLSGLLVVWMVFGSSSA